MKFEKLVKQWEQLEAAMDDPNLTPEAEKKIVQALDELEPKLRALGFQFPWDDDDDE